MADVIQIPSGEQYGYFNVDITDLKEHEIEAKILKFVRLRKKIRDNAIQEQFDCEKEGHPFADTYKAKTGALYKECWCGMQKYQDKEGNWSTWKRPIRSK